MEGVYKGCLTIRMGVNVSSVPAHPGSPGKRAVKRLCAVTAKNTGAPMKRKPENRPIRPIAIPAYCPAV